MTYREKMKALQTKRLAKIDATLDVFEQAPTVQTAQAIDRAIDRAYNDAMQANDGETVTALAAQSRRYMDKLNAIGWA